MNFTRIEYFLVAAKYLNFTRAANVLYISQPSLSKQIAILEEELGVALFERKPRSIVLTQAGKRLYDEFNRIMPEIDAIIEKVKLMKDEVSETLTIGCVESIHLGVIASNAIREFSANAENTEVFIERHGFDALHSKISDGTIDAAFTFSTQIGKMRDINCVDVEERCRHAIVSDDHRLSLKGIIGVKDLRGETFILHSKSV